MGDDSWWWDPPGARGRPRPRYGPGGRGPNAGDLLLVSAQTITYSPCFPFLAIGTSHGDTSGILRGRGHTSSASGHVHDCTFAIGNRHVLFE